MNKIDIDELLKVLPRLIRENDTVKGAIISALSGVVATHADIVELNKAMDKRFESMDKRFETMQKSMDKRFESMDKRFETMQKSMDKRFESMDKRFETMQKSMDKRFESMDKRFETMQKSIDKRFEAVDKQFVEVRSGIQENRKILLNIQQTLGKPFEQFCRNMVVRLLQSEGVEDITLVSKKLKDPKMFVSKDNTEVEIDGFSLDPPIIVGITSILRDKRKVEIFLRKKEFLEKKYNQQFRGFFVAASTEFTPEEIGEITIELRKNNCELINL